MGESLVFAYRGPAANGRLTYNANSEQGVVKFGKLWPKNDIVYRIDVLNDWIFDLEKELEKCMEEHRKEYKDPRVADAVAGCLGWDGG